MSVLAGVGQDMFDYISQYGDWAIAGFLALEEAGVPLVIPGDLLLLYGGYLVSQGELNFWGTLGLAAGGTVVGASILYLVFRYGGLPFVKKYGKYFLLTKERLEYSESWFEKRGRWAVFVGRFLPGLRVILSVVASISGLSYKLFVVQVSAAAVVWAAIFMGLGYILGERWKGLAVSILARAHFLVLVFAAIFIFIVVRQRKGHKRG